MKHKKVFIGLSGGVDSSVAALRLRKAGHEVVGVFIKVWQPDFLNCNWEKERLDAMRVAAKLGIPFLTCDAEAAYKNDVADYFISEYQAGRTPNPDVMCNRHVKFGAFFDFAIENGADAIATGHYAQSVLSEGEYQVHRGIDTNKDQSYFLWGIEKEKLPHIIFPIGDTAKDAIRTEAMRAELPVAEKKDSQGVCFLGHIDIPEFLSHFISLEKGVVLDETGAEIGSHQGALVYTTGQRHGFTINNNDTASLPHFVTARNLENNTITVSATKPTLKNTGTTNLLLRGCNWFSTPIISTRYKAQARYRQTPFEIEIIACDESKAEIKVLGEADSASIGQSCVLYDGNKCLGGGIISA